jgi:polysaccharide biosynthesis transport protein
MNSPKVDSARTPPQLSIQGEEGNIDILNILHRQRWLIVFFAILGTALGLLYTLKAQVWYQSNARVLINQKSPGLSESGGSDMVEEDVLANHIEIIRSRRIVESALTKDGLMNLPSIQPLLGENDDAADYVIDHLELVKGGDGGAKDARSLNVSFTHVDPADARILLESVLVEYQEFIANQLESVMSTANRLVNQAKDEVEKELRAAEAEYLKARKEAPLLFQGEGTSNVYIDKYRRLEEELLSNEIEEASVKTRLDGVMEALESMKENTSSAEQLDKLALIDSDSLERLGLFAGLQLSASRSTEFVAAQPARAAEAQTQYKHMLDLMSEKQRLSAIFGEGHPKVQDIVDEIILVQKFLDDQKEALGIEGIGFGEDALNPETLLRAYVGFLKHDLSAFAERKKELQILSEDAEKQAKMLIDYELQDQVLQSKIARQEELFDSIVHQVRDMDTASGLSGYIYELLETPRMGIKNWPKLPLCLIGGMMLGLITGLLIAVANDMRDGRFRSAAELDQVVRLPMLGRIGKLNSIHQGISGLIAAELSPDAEAFRMGRTLLLPDIRSGKLKTLGMTSAMQGDGKSTVTSNFAVSISQVGLRVLVIDADLRRPSQHRYFSVDITGGITDILEGRLNWKDSVKKTEAENVSIITAGSSTSVPAELLQSADFDKMLEEAANEYDVILIDLPPVLAVSDPLIVAPKIGGLVVVVRAATARKDEVLNMIRRLKSANGEVVGCVLNVFGSGKDFNVEGGYYGYYESSYTRPSSKQGATQSRMSRPSLAEPAAYRNGSDNEESAS